MFLYILFDTHTYIIITDSFFSLVRLIITVKNAFIIVPKIKEVFKTIFNVELKKMGFGACLCLYKLAVIC